MSRFYNRPENALKRAEDLIAVSQPASALTLLHEIVMSKRSRSTPLGTLEPIMLKFVELCVNLRKGKTAKEGLHQYKNISQNITVASIEQVIKRFIELSEAKVADAQAKAEKITLDSVEDLEASETPESIILSTVSAEVDKDRTDREVVTPWLKFLWEAYRTALDILRNNARLEILYQSVANQAFQFCLKYTRKTEFRRLCELLRQHLATAAKYAHQAHAINLNDPDTLQRHLDTRFVQLNAATELQLWQEAFRSVEDIHNLLAMSKKPPKPFMMANYYEKLARIFMVGENYMFHAAAWNKYYGTVRQNKNLSEEEHERMASIVLMSALAIPIITTSKTRGVYMDGDENKPKTARLANLLRVSRTPTREILLKEALSKSVFARVRPELKELYQILEVQFHPLSITKKIAHLLPKLQEDKDLATYVEPLHQVILTRLLQQLSQVYTTIKIDSVVKLASFPEPFSYSAHHIEKFIMNGCKKGELSIRVNHQSQTLTFETDVFAASRGTISEGPQLQSLPSEQMRTQLTRLAKRLHTAVALIGMTSQTLPPEERVVQVKKEAKARAFAEAVERLEEERRQTAQRRLLIEKKKELRENELMAKEKAEQEARKERLEKEREAEKIRQEEESKKREQDRLLQHRLEIQKQEAAKLAAKLAEDLKDKNVKVKQEELETLDTTRLRQIQIEQLEKEKREMQNKLKAIGKKFDHIERAYRKEEIPLFDKDYEEQKVTDMASYKVLIKAKREAAKVQHQEAMQQKSRMLRMLDDYRSLKERMSAERNAEYEAIRADAEARLAEAKQRRIEEYKQRKEEELRRREHEEQERIRQEELARIRAEEEAREAEERAARQEAQHAAEAERLRKLEEVAQKTREREQAIEERLAREREQLRAPPTRPAESEWRRREPAPAPVPVSAAGGATGGKYVPPVRRQESGGGGWRAREEARREEPDAWRRPEAPRSEEPPREERPGTWRPGGGSWRQKAGEDQAPLRDTLRDVARDAPREPAREERSGAWRPGTGGWRSKAEEPRSNGVEPSSAAPGSRWRERERERGSDQPPHDDGFTTVRRTSRR
ncbi:translation initiation factor eIF3 core subunit a [Spizellomyces punctatus DAOM BR117]|uniref:Eukaryotic translation initiation factor 3 subunit A n=1 Tax=Spizellomyces punctatus (strain DAOM BR117) TaxID=645134 RepID=A0A0L0HNG1_SPIPD|nr:translation initiation factor eIF3 core subunit a [Spizellomyces punctatus DAOM BR117]KND02612.1 hypothetical protein SPPG_01699 [Spizellomyces punctatus DAOM BR117]|eukprot:XP_016610651.1 hypothetical protein SPPG_01699 [Spizellomyces punctatus DAOM BR117]